MSEANREKGLGLWVRIIAVVRERAHLERKYQRMWPSTANYTL